MVIRLALKCEKCCAGGAQNVLRGSCPQELCVLRKCGWRIGQSDQRSPPEAGIFELGS